MDTPRDNIPDKSLESPSRTPQWRVPMRKSSDPSPSNRLAVGVQECQSLPHHRDHTPFMKRNNLRLKEMVCIRSFWEPEPCWALYSISPGHRSPPSLMDPRPLIFNTKRNPSESFHVEVPYWRYVPINVNVWMDKIIYLQLIELGNWYCHRSGRRDYKWYPPVN